MNNNNKTQKLRPVKKIPKRILLPEEKIPIWCFVLLGIFVLSLIILILALKNSSFADFFNQKISATLRIILAYLTNLAPFSIAEFFILMLPVVLFVVIGYAIRHKIKSWRSVFSYTVSLLSAASLIFSLFVFVYGTGYHTPQLDEKLSLSQEESISAEELAQTAEILIDDMNQCLWLISYEANGASIMPYSLAEMNDKLIKAYDSLEKKYDFIQSYHSKIKPVLLSVPMSYAHFTGFYTFFTGETNLNVDFPDYTLPFTAAHELAHGRGIARENEANFIAFLACMESTDNYIRYCGLLNMYEYIDSEDEKPLYRRVTNLLDNRVKGELNAFSQFFEKYRNSQISEVSGAINDTFLKVNGSEEGEKSYGLVVNLTVAYYKER